MRHAICKLSFHTAVHFGSDDGGSSLTGARPTFHADVLFSALFRALQARGSAETLLHAVQSGELSFSDAFPWSGPRFFLPRPVGLFARHAHSADEDPSQRKLLKRITYVPADLLEDFLQGRADLQMLHSLNRFGRAFEETRVNRRDGDQPLPYQVSGFRFAEDAGLYLIVSGTEPSMEQFETGMAVLAAEGIGGKISSGWGKFDFEMAQISDRWAKALENDAAPCQMLLSAALPSEEELSAALDDAYYTVLRRGGFAFSEQSRPLKKRTTYLLGAGSTFPRRFEGTVLEVGVGMPHPVWRYARAMFMGVET